MDCTPNILPNGIRVVKNALHNTGITATTLYMETHNQHTDSNAHNGQLHTLVDSMKTMLSNMAWCEEYHKVSGNLSVVKLLNIAMHTLSCMGRTKWSKSYLLDSLTTQPTSHYSKQISFLSSTISRGRKSNAELYHLPTTASIGGDFLLPRTKPKQINMFGGLLFSLESFLLCTTIVAFNSHFSWLPKSDSSCVNSSACWLKRSRSTSAFTNGSEVWHSHMQDNLRHMALMLLLMEPNSLQLF